jgi:hypothetical protein
MRVPRRWAFLLSLIALTGCGYSSVRWRPYGPPAPPSPGSIFVTLQPGPALPRHDAEFEKGLLSIVREHDPRAEIISGSEAAASRQAMTRGGGYLLVVTVA